MEYTLLKIMNNMNMYKNYRYLNNRLTRIYDIL